MSSMASIPLSALHKSPLLNVAADGLSVDSASWDEDYDCGAIVMFDIKPSAGIFEAVLYGEGGHFLIGAALTSFPLQDDFFGHKDAWCISTRKFFEIVPDLRHGALRLELNWVTRQLTLQKLGGRQSPVVIDNLPFNVVPALGIDILQCKICIGSSGFTPKHNILQQVEGGWPVVTEFDINDGTGLAMHHIRVEWPGVSEDDIVVKELPQGINVRIIDPSDPSVAFDRDFVSPSRTFFLCDDQCLWIPECGILKLVLKPRASRLLKFENGGIARFSPQFRTHFAGAGPRDESEACGASPPSYHAMDNNGWSFVPDSSLNEDADSFSSQRSVKCYLPNTAFKSPDGNLRLAKNLQQGSLVLLSDGETVASVANAPKFHKRHKYELVELVTSQCRFKVSKNHRIVVADVEGETSGERRAGELRVGDSVFVGSMKRPLTRVTNFKETTELVEVSFNPDGPVEAFSVPLWGLQTLGEPQPNQSACSSSSQQQSGQHGNALELMSLLSHISEADLLLSIPDAYDD